MKKCSLFLFLLFTMWCCQTTQNYDLVITKAKVLDVKTGKTLDNQFILIRNGLIADIVSNAPAYTAKETIDAQGKLVTPSFIDTHIHPTDVFGDYENAPKFLASDSLNTLRQRLSDAYLPYGTTTVLTMGQPENWLKPLLQWQKNADAQRVDLHLCGGALISKDNRTPYIGHTEVITPQEARQKVLNYYQLGIKHLKLYYRLKEPEFSTAYKTADSLGMRVYGHIGDFSTDYLSINHTLKVGLTHYEHLVTMANNIINTDQDWALLNKEFSDNFGELNTEAKLLAFFLEQFRFINTYKKAEIMPFIEAIVDKKGTFSTTIHRLYEQFDPTFFTNPKDTTLTKKQVERSRENFAILMTYAKTMHDKGVEIRLGSDMPNGGKANISELILLCKHGFSVADAFKIATYNGAKAIGLDNKIGTIEKGKQAHLIIWDKNPFDDYQNFSGKMTVVKDGGVYK